MLNKSNYKVLDSLSYGNISTVFKAKELSNDQPCIFKRVPLEAKEKIKLQGNEYEILKSLKSDRLVKCFGQILDEKENILVLEDFDGQSLDKMGIYGKLDFNETLDLFIQISLAIKDLHDHGFMHKDVNPSNIVWNKKKNILKLIDFDLSSRIKQEFIQFESINKLVGTLSYISPEQTGRLNRPVDLRTDLYSLGVTFYQLLYNKLPFIAKSPVELVYLHLTQEPEFPERKDVPKEFIEVLRILLEKKAEDRYQSISGLIADLELFKTKIAKHESLDFALKSEDFSSTFIIDETLYGRDKEIGALIHAYSKLDANTTQLAFISGESGIGKTMLARELIKTISKRNGIFVSGKYQIFQKDMLGGAVTESLSSYFRFIISDSSEKLDEWKESLGRVLGINAKVLTDVIPELELIMGPQNEPAELGPMESQTRFVLMLVDLLKLIGSYGRPLVMFLDDLQWGSDRSFEILHTLMTSKKIGNIFFIGAYRDNEVGIVHPAQKILNLPNAIKIPLKPLPIDMCLKILKDAFKNFQQVERLNSFIYSKTNGNPYSIKEFVRKLVADGYVFFNNNLRSWDCDFAKLNSAELSENIVVLLAQKIKKLDMDLQTLIGNASILGNKFNLNFLATLLNQSEDAFKKNIYKAIELNFFISLDDESGDMQFCHDKVLEAAYSLLSEEDRMRTHLKIGNKLLHLNEKNITGEAAVKICLHLNNAIELLTDRKSVLRLARLNQKAAMHSRKNSVFHLALTFSTQGIRLLKHIPETLDEKWAKALQVSHAEFLYLTGYYNECEEWVEKCLEETKDNIHAAWLLNQLAIQYTAQGRYVDAISVGKRGLQSIGINLPEIIDHATVEAELKTVKALLKVKSYDNLEKQAEMVDQKYKLAMVLLINMDSPSYLSDIDLYCIVVARMVQISITKGPVPSSAKAYASYGIVLSAYNEFETAYRFTELGIKIAERFNHLGQLCRACHTMANHVQYWSEHIKYGDAYNDRGDEAGMKAGEYLWVGFIKLFKCYNQFFRGRDLSAVKSESLVGLEFCREHPNQLGIDTLKGLGIIIDSLVEEDKDSAKINNEFINDCKKNNSLMSLSMFMSARVFKLILLEEEDLARKEIKKSIELLPYSFALVTNVFDFFSDSYLMIRSKEELSDLEKKTLETNLNQLKKWAKSCPENFLHFYLICKAEKALRKGRSYKAIEYYDRALASANASSYTHVEAFVCQRLAQIWHDQKNKDVSFLYAEKSFRLYNLWGAKRIARKTKNKYGIKEVSRSLEGSMVDIDVDVYTILQAYQVMGEKLVREDLIKTMFDLMRVNSGATTVALYQADNSGPFRIKETVGAEYAREIPQSFLRYVLRSGRSYIYQVDTDLPSEDFSSFTRDHNISLACIPLGGECVIALINDQYEGMFSREKMKLLKLLTKQLHISLNNIESYARLEKFNEELEVKVKERTLELEKSKNEAEAISNKLRATQRELIDAARYAGEADVKTNVLHNLGNAFSVLLGKIEEFEILQNDNDVSDLIDLLVKRVSEEKGYQVGENVSKLLDKIRTFSKDSFDKRRDEFHKLKEKTKLLVTMIHSQNVPFKSSLVENIDLNDLIKDSIVVCRLDENCEVSINLKNVDYVDIDYAKVKNIMFNFVSNALEACRGTERRAQIFITAGKEHGELSIEVTDNGIGMDEATLKKVFDAGFSTKPSGTRPGYGLHNSANVARQLGGRIEAESKGPGMGSTFRLILPLQERDNPKDDSNGSFQDQTL